MARVTRQTWGTIGQALKDAYLQGWAVDHPNETLPNVVVAEAEAYSIRQLAKLLEGEPVE